MGSLKFTIGLSLLSYESRRPSLCTSFKFSDGLPVSSLRSPYSVLFEAFLPFIETCWFRTGDFALEKSSVSCRKKFPCLFRFLLKVAYLELSVVPYLRLFSFCDYTIAQGSRPVHSQKRQSSNGIFVHVMDGNCIDGCGIIIMFGVPKNGMQPFQRRLHPVFWLRRKP